MVWWQQILDTVIFGILIIFAIYWPIRANRVRAQNLQEFQVPRLREFAEIATLSIAKRYPDNIAKTDLAVAAVANLFMMYDLKAPPKEAMLMAVDAFAPWPLEPANPPKSSAA